MQFQNSNFLTTALLLPCAMPPTSTSADGLGHLQPQLVCCSQLDELLQHCSVHCMPLSSHLLNGQVCTVQGGTGQQAGRELRLNPTPAAEHSTVSQYMSSQNDDGSMTESPAYRSGVDINFLRSHDL